MDFLKEIAVGYKTAKSYPPGHPVMDKVVTSSMEQLSKLYAEISEFSTYFLEKTIIFQDMKIDVSKNLAIASLLEALRKIEINSLTFEPEISDEDIKNLFTVIISPKLKIKEYGDAAIMLGALGTKTIKVNAVKFGIQTGATTQVAQTSGSGKGKESADITKAIMNLKGLVTKGLSLIETKNKFSEIMDDIESTPEGSRQSYRDNLANIIGNLPAEQQNAFLKESGSNSSVSKLFSNLSDEMIVNLISAQIERKESEGMENFVNVIDEEKFAKIMPKLKEKIPNIYEYLAQVGLILSEKLASTVSKDDLRVSMKPYYSMVDSESANFREKGLRSLIMLADRFMGKGNYDLAKGIILRISTAIEQESVSKVILKSMDDLGKLYKTIKEHKQNKTGSLILEPFSKILGRGELSVAFKKKTIQFFSETGNPVVLPMLFSFLWEIGIYPDVRAAILKFGKHAVSEALLTLKEAEDKDLRRKLIDILKNIGTENVEILVNNLDTSEWFLKATVITILGEIGNTSVVEHLVPLLEDPDDRVRLELVKAFRKLKYDEGLVKCLNDASSEVKTEALKGLRKTISSEKTKELMPLFKQRGDTIHAALLNIIGDKKLTDVADSIVEFLISLEPRNDSEAEQLKELGINTLVKLNIENIKPILEDLKQSKDKKLAQFSKIALKRMS